jgi:hypothetical protein
MSLNMNRKLNYVAVLGLTAGLLLVGSTATLAEEKPPPSKPDSRAELAKKVVAIAKLHPFDPSRAARILGARLGPASKPTEYITEYELIGVGDLLTGTVAKTPRATSVTIQPAASLGLAFQDLDALLLEYPHEIESLRAHFGEVEQRTVAVRHWFQVPAGRLALEVWADKPASSDERALISDAYSAARGQASRRSVIKKISVSDRRDDEGAPPPTLRQRRTEKGAGAKAKN